MPTHTYVRPGLVYMVGSERRNSVVVVFMGRQRRRRVHGEATECVVFMGRQRNARVHREATERVGANRLGRNGMRGRVHREVLDGIGNGNKA